MLHGYNYRELHTVAPGFVCLVIAHGLIRLRGTHVGLGGGWERVVWDKERGETCSEGDESNYTQTSHLRPITSRRLLLFVSRSLSPVLDSASPWHRSFFIRGFFASFREQANNGSAGSVGRVHTASFSGFSPAPFFFSTFSLSLSLSPLFSSYPSSLLFSIASGRLGLVVF